MVEKQRLRNIPTLHFNMSWYDKMNIIWNKESKFRKVKWESFIFWRKKNFWLDHPSGMCDLHQPTNQCYRHNLDRVTDRQRFAYFATMLEYGKGCSLPWFALFSSKIQFLNKEKWELIHKQIPITLPCTTFQQSLHS